MRSGGALVSFLSATTESQQQPRKERGVHARSKFTGVMRHRVDGLATGLEVAGGTASAAKKLALHFPSPSQSGTRVHTHCGSFHFPVNLVQELPHRHVHSFVS